MISLRTLTDLLDPGTAKSLLGHVDGSYQGRRVTVSEQGEDDGLLFWNFRVDCRARIEFEILSEESQSVERSLGVSKAGVLGFGRDDEVNDQQLDSLFAFRSSDPPRFSVWVHNSQVKRSLIGLAFHSRHIVLREIEIHFKMPKPELFGVLEEVLRQLCNLASSAEQAFPSGASIPSISSSKKRLITYLILGALLAALVHYLTL